MKIGAAAWNFTHPHYQPPYEEAIKTVGEMGVDGIELIAFTSDDLKNYYTKERCADLKARVESYGMVVSEFVLYSYVVVGLLNKDEAKRQESLDIFKRGMEIASMLGTDLVNIVSNWPDEFKVAIPYLPYNIHPSVNGYQRFNPKLQMEIPDDFDAPATWERYMDSIKKVVSICEEHNMRFALEGHANVIVGNTDALLRAFDWVPSDSFGTNFDTSWHLMQREYLPWSVMKLGKKIFHVHIRDADGLLTYTIPVGQGIIDWNGFVKALKKIGFDGFLSLELGGLVDQNKYVRESIEHIRRILREENALG